ncbi:MAG: gliding motility-associated C-terminal domain-containing protein [Candidatus Parvibacillus calidus]|nr:MAG: gliding motility-associated C-terminal domain-containing protein [Candidatus Parvibacillus calidus]
MYELKVTNATTGCVKVDEVEVRKDDKAIDGINIELDSISCYNKGDGEVRIIGVTGGTPDFKYSLDGSAYTAQSVYSNIGPGSHIIRVEDVNGCKYDLPILLDNPKEVKVELGNNKVIAEGDAVTITPDVSIGVNGAAIDWTSNPPGTSCVGCAELTVQPLITTTYIATVRDRNGCTAVDSMEVRVKSVIRVFIPNVISPNNDGINDVFYVQTDQNIVRVKSMTIYNRWGMFNIL